MMEQTSWKDKFYELAEIYFESSSLLKYALNRLLISEAELKISYNKEVSDTQNEAFLQSARTVLAIILDGIVKPKPAPSEKRKKVTEDFDRNKRATALKIKLEKYVNGERNENIKC